MTASNPSSNEGQDSTGFISVNSGDCVRFQKFGEERIGQVERIVEDGRVRVRAFAGVSIDLDRADVLEVVR